MIVEITAGRMVSRYLGQSLYSWTSVIGVVLAGLSLGNYLGGFVADRFGPQKALGLTFVAGSASCIVIPPLLQAVNSWPWLVMQIWPVRILVAVLSVFFFPSLVLGLISPVAARAALLANAGEGRTIGSVYAWGVVGSIAGTFVAGFWLIAALGTVRVIVTISVILGVAAIVYGHRQWLPRLWAVVVAAVVFAAFGPGPGAAGLGALWHLRERDNPSALFADESNYQYVLVKAMSTNTARRGLYLDKMLHSEVDIEHPTNLLYRYAWVYEAVLDRESPPGQPLSAFVIGGGAYTFPMYLALTRPGSHVDVAEIDPMVTRAALDECGFVEMPEIRVRHMDARNFVTDQVRRKREGEAVPEYDYVFGDTFNDYSVPYHLTTREFTQDLYDLMSPNGMYMLNMIDRFDHGRFLGSIVKTFSDVFPYVAVFYCHLNLSRRGTYVVIAGKRPLDLAGIEEAVKERHPFYGRRLTDDEIAELLARCEPVLLTDDYAPVENLLAPVVMEDRPESVDIYFVKDGLELAAKGDINAAIAAFEQALEVNPSNDTALYNLGVAWMQKEDAGKALLAFGAALAVNPDHVEVRNNAGVVLVGVGRLDEAKVQFEEILRIQPTNTYARVNIAKILAYRGNTNDAVALLNEALEIDPGYLPAGEMLRQLGR